MADTRDWHGGHGPKLIVALDVPTAAEALKVAGLLVPDVDYVKVGLSLFCAEGPRIIEQLKEVGVSVFLDLKLHDIPAQVGATARTIGAYGVDMVTVHCLGGSAMLKAARQGIDEGARAAGLKSPMVVGVTILTSLDEYDLENMGVNNHLEREVGVLAGLAKDAGLDGVVASARELRAVRSEHSGDFIVVTPGIRPAGEVASDQKRVFTPAAAVAAGASYLVVGRPITQSRDPKGAARAIIDQMRH